MADYVIRMKFTFDADLEFEAKDMDEALMKLALYFISNMEQRPIFNLGDLPPLDALGTLLENMPSLNADTASGFIAVEFGSDFESPRLMQ